MSGDTRRITPTSSGTERWRLFVSIRVATWLILPVVVCLAQKLSHVSPCTTRLQMAAYNSYGLFDGPTLLG